MSELEFIGQARKIIDHIERAEGESLHQAAEQCADTISQGGLVHLYAGGHSRMRVEETFARIGSIVGTHPSRYEAVL